MKPSYSMDVAAKQYIRVRYYFPDCIYKCDTYTYCRCKNAKGAMEYENNERKHLFRPKKQLNIRQKVCIFKALIIFWQI